MKVAEHVFGTVACVKAVVQVKLLPTPGQASALVATLHACNEAAGFVSRVAFERNVKSRNELQKLCRVFGRPVASIVTSALDGGRTK